MSDRVQGYDNYRREFDLQRTYRETIMVIVIDSTATNKYFCYTDIDCCFSDFWTSTKQLNAKNFTFPPISFPTF